MFVRDTDSRIHDRDIACIEDFINSDKLLHIIRDHCWHNTFILGGLWGIRKIALTESMNNIIQRWLANQIDFSKGVDQHFLAQTIYPSLRSNVMIHDRYNFYKDESISSFRIEIKNRLFCGQVHKYDSNGIEYTKYNP